MTYKQIEAARELRLWLGQIVIPAATVVVVAMSNPEVKRTVVETKNNIKRSIGKKFKKEDNVVDFRFRE